MCTKREKNSQTCHFNLGTKSSKSQIYIRRANNSEPCLLQIGLLNGTKPGYSDMASRQTTAVCIVYPVISREHYHHRNTLALPKMLTPIWW